MQTSTPKTKAPWQSKTMWGGVMIAVAMILQQFGIDVDNPDAAANDVVSGIEIVGQLIGIGLVFWGRFTAKSKIEILPATGFGPALLLSVLLPLAACQASPGGYPTDDPRGQYDAAQETFIATVSVLITAKQADLIKQNDWDKTVLPLIKSGDAVLDDMEAAAVAEDATVTQTHLHTFRSILRQLIAWQLKIKSTANTTTERNLTHERTAYFVDRGSHFTGAGQARSDDPQARWQSRSGVSGQAQKVAQTAGQRSRLTYHTTKKSKKQKGKVSNRVPSMLDAHRAPGGRTNTHIA